LSRPKKLVYRHKRSPFYQTDIWHEGVKFSRSTGKSDKREAQIEAKRLAEELIAELKDKAASETSTRLDAVAERYMRDVGDHHAGTGAAGTEAKLALVVHFFTEKYGPDIDLIDIDHDKATQLKNWRRKHRVGDAAALLNPKTCKARKGAKLIGGYTVNDTMEQLKKLFTFMRRRHVVFKNAPDFKRPGDLWVDEPKSRERILSPTESDNLDHATVTVRGGDYDPLIQFSRTTGKRKKECYALRWTNVKWDRNEIRLRGKGNKEHIITITPAIRAILWPLRDHHPEFVFTYVAQRTRTVRRAGGVSEDLVEGQRYPITKDGLRKAWDKIRKAAGLPVTGEDRFRYHDIRHDFASNLLASIPTVDGLKVVQEALGHADIETTMRYSHVTAGRVADAIEAQAQARAARMANHRTGKNHRTNHRTGKLKVV
jgi:integrase